MCYTCAAEGYPYDSETCKDCEFKPTERMVSIGDVMKILDGYAVYDGLYTNVNKNELAEKFLRASVEINKKPYVEEVWCE